MIKKRAKRWWFVSGVALAAVIFIGIRWHGHNTSKIVYKSIQVVRGKVVQKILSTGTIAPEDRLDLTPPVAGRIEKVLVQEGQMVHTGQVLAWMSSTERATMIDTARAEGPAALKYWEAAYKMTPILAPSNGMIILKGADPGQTVTQSSVVLSMAD